MTYLTACAASALIAPARLFTFTRCPSRLHRPRFSLLYLSHLSHHRHGLDNGYSPGLTEATRDSTTQDRFADVVWEPQSDTGVYNKSGVIKVRLLCLSFFLPAFLPVSFCQSIQPFHLPPCSPSLSPTFAVRYAISDVLLSHLPPAHVPVLWTDLRSHLLLAAIIRRISFDFFPCLSSFHHQLADSPRLLQLLCTLVHLRRFKLATFPSSLLLLLLRLPTRLLLLAPFLPSP